MAISPTKRDTKNIDECVCAAVGRLSDPFTQPWHSRPSKTILIPTDRRVFESSPKVMDADKADQAPGLPIFVENTSYLFEVFLRQEKRASVLISPAAIDHTDARLRCQDSCPSKVVSISM